MFITSWIERIRQTLKQDSRRRLVRHETTGRACEQLEERSLLSAQSFFINGEIDIALGSTDSVAIRENPVAPGTVQVVLNGTPDPNFPTVSASAVTKLLITGGDDANLIDLTGMTAAVFNNVALSIEAHGGNGDDTLLGSDSLNDSLDGGHGADSVDGNGGDDILLGDDGNDTINGGAGNDNVDAGDGQDSVDGGTGNDTIVAGDGQDSVTGSAGFDSIDGGNGLDTLLGGDDGDIINGGAGADSIDGQAGNDTIFGGANNDTLLGGSGADSLDGQGGSDIVLGGGGNDLLAGGTGDDIVTGEAGDDTLNGGAGNDTLDGSDGNDSMLGGNGNDSIVGGNGDDTGKGQAGNDTLNGTTGADVMDGGAGQDTIFSGTVASVFLVSIDNAATLEGTGNANTVSLTVSLTGAAASTITVDYVTVSGTATAGSDFSQASGTLTFAPGTTSQQINISITTDSVDEFFESFTVNLTNAVGAIINDGSGLVTITDDDGPSSVVSTATAFTAAVSYLERNADRLGLTHSDVENFEVTKTYTTDHNGVTHVYLQQTYQGLPVIDSTITVNVMPDGSILSAYSSFVSDVASLNLSTTPTLTTSEAFAGLGLELAEALANDPHGHGGNFVGEIGDGTQQDGPQNSLTQGTEEQPDEITPLRLMHNAAMPDRLQWAKTDDGGLSLVWTINVQTVDVLGWYDSSVDATTGELLNNVSWISHASYNVINYNEEAPLYAPRTIEVDPQDTTASPFGWHDTNGVAGPEFTDTRGNNVFAQGARDDDPLFDLLFGGNLGTGPRPNGGASLDFNSPFDDTQAPSTYLDAATTNLFYTNNILHDIHYQYGFDEASGNFQVNNYGNGGLGNDAVNANAQSGANLPAGGFTRNNAFMATPPDGQSPIMAMFEWNLDFSTFNPINPARDSDFENGIIIHEYGHGVSNRLTDRSGNADGLQAIQSGGMGEGWSDWWALMFTQQAGDLPGDARPIGNYVQAQSASGPGIRRFPYSFDLQVSPLTFTAFNADPIREVHNTGELWAQSLWDMNWLLINGISTPDCEGNVTPGYGFDPDLYNGTGGNNLALQLVMDGLKLQPANPSFVQSRDAILQADLVNNGGVNSRQIWTAFARRGLGYSATAGADGNTINITTAFDLPPELGAIRLDAQVYSVGDVVGINVCDTDVAAASNTITVVVTTAGGDSETVTLIRQANQNFTGTITTQRGAPGVNNRALDINGESDLLTATYIDPNDGSNNGSGVAVTLQALAVINAGVGDTLLGGDGNDVVTGGSGDDFINVGGGNDTVFAGAGNDSVLGGSGADLLDGQDGDDTLAGQGGNDTLIGGAGDDTFQWSTQGDGDDVVSSLTGFDQMQIIGTSAANVVSIGKLGPRVQVTSGSSVLTVNANISVISIDLGAGDDTLTIGDLSGVSQTVLTINGGDGNDTLDASAGVLGDVRLRLNGNAGNDRITGSANDDTIDGGAGLDSLLGGTGNDTIFGGADNDVISGQAGDDSITGDDGNDTLTGGDGNDIVSGGLGNDSLNGNAGADTLIGAEGRDTLSGGDGNDSLDAGGGRDSLSGGNGDDTLDGGRNDDTILGDAGNDTIRGNHGNDSIDGGAGDDTISGGDGNDTITGGDGNDLATGADGDDVINGAAGNDTLSGGDGNDIIAGGGGSDVVLGDDGDDTLKGNGGTNTIAGGQGNDTILSLPTDILNDSFVLADDLLRKLDLL